MKYLDPKNDLTFRKIFGEHPHLLISLLNNLLPLDQGQVVESIEYLDIEIIPELPGFKRSLVDVRCTDNMGRSFLVEMQTYWTNAFQKRVLFNAGKAFVKQLKGGGQFRDLKPVYALSFIDDTINFSDKLEGEYYHHFSMVHSVDNNVRIEGLELIFIELPNFAPETFTEKRLRSLWLRFLTEIDENTQEVAAELQNEALIREALECVQKDAFTEGELEYYEEYWDSIRHQKAGLEDAHEQNIILKKEKEEAQKAKEKAQKEKEKAQKREKEAQKEKEEAQKREEEANTKFAMKMLKYNEPVEEIQKETGLSKEQIEQLIKNMKGKK